MLGLGPVAVLTSFRSNGIDTMLIERGIDLARAQGWPAIVVLGPPEYYERFGFVPASRFGLTCEFRAPAGAFMVLELLRGTLKGWGEGGVVRYEPEFSRI
jgi:putative acetyltransferase